jgi:hypothetical protein
MSPLLTPSDPSRVLIDRGFCRQDHAATLNATEPYELAPDASPPLRLAAAFTELAQAR